MRQGLSIPILFERDAETLVTAIVGVGIGIGAITGTVTGMLAATVAGVLPSVSGALPVVGIGAITGALSAAILGIPLLPIATLGAAPGAIVVGIGLSAEFIEVEQISEVAGVLALATGVLATGLIKSLLEIVKIITEEEISLISATKIILATTPLYWMSGILTSWQLEGLGSKMMGFVEAMAMTIFTSVMDGVVLPEIHNSGFKLFTGLIAATQLVDAYNTWNKYSALEAEIGESEGSKLPVVGLQLLTFAASTILLSSAGVGLLAGAHIPIILGTAQLLLYSYADKVISEKREDIVQAEMARG